MREVTWEEFQREAVKNMAALDALPPAHRDLVREFGLVIVVQMYNEGYRNAQKLRDELETWRERRQETWLATDYITDRDRERALAAIRRLR